MMLKRMLLITAALLLALPLVPEAGAAITPEAFSIHFALNSSRLDSTALKEIDALADYLRRQPDLGIAIGGHTDASGPQQLNQRLSKARAAAVRNALIKKGIAPQRLSISWLAAQLPLASNRTEAGRARNRRAAVLFSGPLSAATPRKSVAKAAIQAPRQRAATKARVPKKTEVRVPKKSVAPKPARSTRKTVTKSAGTIIEFLPGGNILSRPALGVLSKQAEALKANPQASIVVTGILPKGQHNRATLQHLRSSIELVRSTLIYGHQIPARQVGSGWSSEETSAARIEIR